MLVAALCASPIACVMLDIHIEFGDEDYFNKLDTEIHKLLPNDQIDLINTSMPHVTLYLTEFENSKIQKIIEEYVAKALNSQKPNHRQSKGD